MALLEDGGETDPYLLPSIEVRERPAIPGPGDRAPRIHTPTVDGVGDIRLIDTRTPPDSMHEVDFFDVVGVKPTVLLFSTPALCSSRVCGPMVDTTSASGIWLRSSSKTPKENRLLSLGSKTLLAGEKTIWGSLDASAATSDRARSLRSGKLAAGGAGRDAGTRSPSPSGEEPQPAAAPRPARVRAM